MTFPKRIASDFPRIDWSTLKELTFDEPDLDKFRCLALAFQAIDVGGTLPAVLNAANEIAVERFLNRYITFDQIATLIEKTLDQHQFIKTPSVEDLLNADMWARRFTSDL